jgi:hypothetical protein
MNIGVQVFVWVPALNVLGMELTDRSVILCRTFWVVTTLFSISAIPLMFLSATHKGLNSDGACFDF